MKLTPRQYRIFRRIQKKYNVSVPFILSNMANIRKFVWYAMCPRLVIKRMAVRRQPSQRIVLEHYCLRRVLFDQSLLKIIKRRKRNVSQWSNSMVQYLRRTVGVKEYVEDHYIQTPPKMSTEDVDRQLKEQLELLKSGKRTLPQTLINDAEKILTEKTDARLIMPPVFENLRISEMTPEKQMIIDDKEMEDADILAQVHTRRESGSSTDKTENCDENTVNEHTERTKSCEKVQLNGSKFLDMLMSKMNTSNKIEVESERKNFADFATEDSEADLSVSSNEDFAGFEDVVKRKKDDFAPTLLPTPIVTSENRIFESEKLDKFLKANDLECKNSDNLESAKDKKNKIKQEQMPQITLGLVRLHSIPPALEKPLVPTSLQRLRTVAERRQYLQRHARNYRLAIINNEAAIYRELQRKSKRRSQSMLSLQNADNQVPFTREGWRAASFLATEVNKYYFQVLPIEDQRTYVHLPGVHGNHTEYFLKPYCTRVPKVATTKCPSNCIDAAMNRHLKLLKAQYKNSKLLGKPLRAVLPACPLSHKPFQKPLDDDTAALLTAGGNMLIVRLPTVELEVFPEVGKPLAEIPKRYLEHLLPHEQITPEWAEFSVSTLIQPSSVDDEPGKEHRKSFVFPIPYANERNQILARYVIDRSEKLDKSFQAVASQEAHNDFNFRANIDTSDEDLLVCADVLSDMINCVAISCSENSFIKDDPDVNYNNELIKEESHKTIKSEPIKSNEHKIATTHKKGSQVNELKRLDAIIIDAGAQVEKSEDQQQCTNDYCALGCICGSLNEQYPFRQHCGKSRCIIECVCKSGPLGRIMRLETDGRAITSETAYQLHQQATASLTRNEKKFSATVVITEKGSLVINESQYDKKRRCTKAPKRYEDFTESTDNETNSDYARTPTKKQISLETLNSSEKPTREEPLNEAVFVDESVLQQLKHCTINVVRLELPNDIEPWCMIHELYKCFCKGSATVGKPVHLYKEKDAPLMQNMSNETVKENVQIETKPLLTRPYYTFEKKEKSTRLPWETTEDEEGGVEEDERELIRKRSRGRPRLRKRNASAKALAEPAGQVEEEEALAEPSIDETTTAQSQEDDDVFELKLNYMLKYPNHCRRVVPIPANIYQRCNESRAEEVKAYVKKTETEKTQLLLNEHTLRSVYYHKQEVDQARKRIEEARLKSNKMYKQLHERYLEQMKRRCQTTKERQKKDDLFKEKEQMVLKLKKEIKEQTLKRNISQVNEQEVQEDVQPLKKIKMEVVELSDDEEEEKPKTTNEPQFTLPKIKNCYSLNAKAPESMSLPKTAETMPMNCQIMTDLANDRNKVNKTLYSEVMTTMNQLVAKKMQDVDFALKRVCKVIPQPNNDILSLATWTNFLRAFKCLDIYVWHVKMPRTHFLAVTLTKTMPIVEDAVAVVNIVFQPKAELPLMGRMLVGWVNDSSTSKLAIIMQGRADYWLIKGFLRADERSACPKPTPETHPLLTRKINVLFTLLMKQRLKRLQRAQERAQQLVNQQNVLPTVQQQIAELQKNVQTPQDMLRAALMKPLQKTTTTNQRSLLKIDDNKMNKNLTKISDLLQNQTETITKTTTTTTTATTINSVMTTTTATTITATSNLSNAMQKPTTTTTTTMNAVNLKKKTFFKDWNVHSNLEIRGVLKQDLIEFHQPIMCKDDHRWLVLDIKNDFSHILVHDFHDLMPLDRVQQMMNVSSVSKKIIRLQFCQNAAYDAFVTPTSQSKLYFGPLKSNATLPIIVLLQSVDSEMMTREQFQKKHNIVADRKNRTTGFLMWQNNSEIYFEYYDETSNQDLKPITTITEDGKYQKLKKIFVKKSQINFKTNTNKLNANDVVNDADNDDCLIIDEDVNKSANALDNEIVKPMFSFAIQQQQNSLQINETTKSNDIPISIVSTKSSFLPLVLPKTTLLSVSPENEKQQQQQQIKFKIIPLTSKQNEKVNNNEGDKIANENISSPLKRKLEMDKLCPNKIKVVQFMTTLNSNSQTKQATAITTKAQLNKEITKTTKTTTTAVTSSFTPGNEDKREESKKSITIVKTNGLLVANKNTNSPPAKIICKEKSETKFINNSVVDKEKIEIHQNIKLNDNITIKPKINVYAGNNYKEPSTSNNNNNNSNNNIQTVAKGISVVKQQSPNQGKGDQHVFCGIINPLQSQLPSFFFKRIRNDYFIKMLDSSILRFTGYQGVPDFLNEYCKKRLSKSLQKYLPTVWTYRLFANEKNKKTEESKTTQSASPSAIKVIQTVNATLTKPGKYVTILPKTKQQEMPLPKQLKRKAMPIMAAGETIVIED